MLDNIPRLHIGQLAIDPLTFPRALEEIGRLIDSRRGGFVFTANVDHVVLAEDHADFRAAYAKADLAVADGMPVVWASRLLDVPLPERIAGSDLILPLMASAAERRWRVYLLGGGPGVAARAGERLRERYAVDIVGVDAPELSNPPDPARNGPILNRIRQATPDLVLVALGSPKQELWIHQVADQLRPAVAIGIGAGLDFVSGRLRRAPRWVSRAGFEWLYRLLREPRRLWRRYFVQDPRFLRILLHTLGRSRALGPGRASG